MTDKKPGKKPVRKKLDKKSVQKKPTIRLEKTTAGDAFDCDYGRVTQLRASEIAQSLWLPSTLSEEERTTKITAAIEALAEIKPADGLERMLAVQMIASHEAAMDCMRLAMVQGQTFEQRDVNLKHAQKLVMTYAKQLATLDKHRGKGKQKITVKRINVEAGGQAIVGNIAAEGTQETPEAPITPETIDHEATVPDNVSKLDVKRRSKGK